MLEENLDYDPNDFDDPNHPEYSSNRCEECGGTGIDPLDDGQCQECYGSGEKED